MKNKVILGTACLFSMLFLGYIFKLTSDIKRDEELLLASPNVVDVTSLIKTKILVTKEELPESIWGSANFEGLPWSEVRLPSHQIIKDKDYAAGSFVYYKILVPKEASAEVLHLKGQLDLALQLVFINKVEVFVNGKFLRINTPSNYTEAYLNIPVKPGIDNVVSIKGTLKDGDRGIEHRKAILLGKSAELNALYGFSYRGSIVFPLIFVLCKGSVIFVFTLIYLLLNVGKFFEKSLLFSMCAVGEDVLTGDFLSSVLNLNIRAYLHNLFSFGTCVFLFLFLADVVGKPVKRKHALIGSLILGIFSFLMISDVLYKGVVFDFALYVKFWVVSSVVILCYFIPQVFKFDKVLFGVIGFTVTLTVWSTLVSPNVGLNLKLFGNLLLFFMVAYQSFALFRREQLLLQTQQIQLLEQEKDVAIGKTASLLAHDVRRPLEQMKLILEKVSGGQVTEDFLKAAKNDVIFSITSVNNQINDIMNYSKTRDVKLTSISFYSVLAGSLKQIMTINKEMNLNLEYDFKANSKVLGDESRLSSALTNLISNAVEAIRDIGKKSSGVIRISTEVQNQHFICRIFNDGPSIPDHMLKEIWKPLFTHGKENGTGLGLSSVMKTMNDHGGSIHVRNVGSSGVEFTFTIRIANSPDEIHQNEFKSKSQDYDYNVKKASEVDQKTLRIFLLDDDAQVEDYFKFLIQNLPYKVELTFVTHFESAATLVQSKRFDLYILDYDLGGERSGVDFYDQYLKHLHEEVIIHTNRERTILSGKNCGYNKKPMSPEDLFQLCEATDQKRLKILLVDDSELTRMTWEMFHGSHNITLASSPEEAVRILNQKQDFDIVVVDYYFDNSQMNGETLAKNIQELNPAMKVVLASNSELTDTTFKSIDKNHFDVRDL